MCMRALTHVRLLELYMQTEAVGCEGCDYCQALEREPTGERQCHAQSGTEHTHKRTRTKAHTTNKETLSIKRTSAFSKPWMANTILKVKHNSETGAPTYHHKQQSK